MAHCILHHLSADVQSSWSVLTLSNFVFQSIIGKKQKEIYDELKKELERRLTGDLRDKNGGTIGLIKKLKKKYMSSFERDRFGTQELPILQRKYQGSPYPLKENADYITNHLKLTCRYIIFKFRVGVNLLSDGTC